MRPFSTYLHDVASGVDGDGDTEGSFAVVGHLVAGGLFVVHGDEGDILQAQLVLLVSLYNHAAYVVYVLELIAHTDAYATVAVVEVSAVNGFVLSVERLEYLGGFNTQIGHLVLQELHIDTLTALAVDIHAGNALYLANLSLHQFCIIG
jgi:hypothetical protein